MKKTRKWGRSAPERPSEEAKERQPPLPEKRPLRLTSHMRSDFAVAVYPQLTRKDAGFRVAQDIANIAELRAAMYRAGYRPGMKGYTDAQLAVLVKHYSQFIIHNA